MTNIVLITGATSGLGEMLASFHTASKDFVLRVGYEPSLPCRAYDDDLFNADLTNPDHIKAVAAWARRRKIEIEEEVNELLYPVLVNCAGVNYIEWFQQLDWNEYERIMRLNVRAGIQLAQELIGTLPPFGNEDPSFFLVPAGDEVPGGCICNVVSNASHMPMTNSVAYNASKGAFHIATLAMGRELRKTHGITVFGISPNKLRGTEMSAYIEERVPGLRGWTPEQAAAYQLGALPAGEETDPYALAEFMHFLLQEPYRHKFITNTVIPYGA